MTIQMRPYPNTGGSATRFLALSLALGIAMLTVPALSSAELRELKREERGEAHKASGAADRARAAFMARYSWRPSSQLKPTSEEAKRDAEQVIAAHMLVITSYPNTEIAAYSGLGLAGFYQYLGQTAKAIEQAKEVAAACENTSYAAKADMTVGLMYLQAAHDPVTAKEWLQKIPKPAVDALPTSPNYTEQHKLYLSAQESIGRCDLEMSKGDAAQKKAPTPGSGTAVPAAKTPSDGPTRTMAEVLATWPAPKLAGLVERSRPDVRGADAENSFWDILKLRDIGDRVAVPVLAEILAINAGSGRTHGYAAAQALFCIGGDQAFAALDKHLFQIGEYNEQLATMYAFHWDMPEPKRGQFVERYLLKSIGNDIEVALEAKPEEGGKIQFGLTVRNVSDKPLDVLVPVIDKLYLRAADGRFLPWHEMRIKADRPIEKWVLLKPGETQTVTASAISMKADEIRKANPRLPKEAREVLRLGNVEYYISELGKCQAQFVLEQRPLAREQKEKLKLENPWSGRAVSKPITIDLVEPATH